MTRGLITLSPAAMRVIADGRVEGGLFFLPDKQLEPTLYREVNKALEASGGVWHRGSKAHLFGNGDADSAIEAILLTGTATDEKRKFEAFDTPPEIVNRMVVAAGGMGRVERGLEPSAGRGSIAKMMANFVNELVMVEIDPMAVQRLRELQIGPVIEGDFLNVTPPSVIGPPYDLIMMNPPFGNQADAKHILHASTFLKPDGMLVAVASASVMLRETKIMQRLRNLITNRGGLMLRLPEGAFRESGTEVQTILVKLPGEAVNHG